MEHFAAEKKYCTEKCRNIILHYFSAFRAHRLFLCSWFQGWSPSFSFPGKALLTTLWLQVPEHILPATHCVVYNHTPHPSFVRDSTWVFVLLSWYTLFCWIAEIFIRISMLKKLSKHQFCKDKVEISESDDLKWLDLFWVYYMSSHTQK